MIADSELLRRYHEKGDQEAFAEIVRRHVSVVYSAAILQSRGRSRADDITQSVFVAMARKAKVLAGRDNLVGWLYTSARYAALNLARSEVRREARDREFALEDHAMNDETTNSDEKTEEAKALKALLGEALFGLKEDDRTAVLLRFWENRSWEEIAESLSTTSEGARKRVERSIERLRERLGRKGIASSGAAISAALSGSLMAAPSDAVPAIIKAVSLTGSAGIATGGGIIALLANSKLLFVAAIIVTSVAVGSAVHDILDARARQQAAEAAERQRIAVALSLANTKAQIRLALAKAKSVRTARIVARVSGPQSPSTRVRNATADFLRNDPQALAMAKESRGRYYALAYARFITEQQISPEQAERLVSVLADYAPLNGGGYTIVQSPADLDNSRQRQAALTQILGADGMRALDVYDSRMTDSAVVTDAMELMLVADPTIAPKAPDLDALLRATRDESVERQMAAIEASGANGGAIDESQGFEAAEAKAAAFLTPDQLQTLHLAAEAITGKEDPRS